MCFFLLAKLYYALLLTSVRKEVQALAKMVRNMRTKIDTGFIPSIVEIHGKKYFYNHYVMTGLALPSDLEHTCWFCSHATFCQQIKAAPYLLLLLEEERSI